MYLWENVYTYEKEASIMVCHWKWSERVWYGNTSHYNLPHQL